MSYSMSFNLETKTLHVWPKTELKIKDIKAAIMAIYFRGEQRIQLEIPLTSEKFFQLRHKEISLTKTIKDTFPTIVKDLVNLKEVRVSKATLANLQEQKEFSGSQLMAPR